MGRGTFTRGVAGEAGEFDQLKPKVLQAMPDDGTRLFPSEIAKDVSASEGEVGDCLDNLAEDGRVSEESGKYWKP